MKVAYFEGRPSGHPLHSKYADAVGSEFFYMDYFWRYQDRPNASILRKLVSWIFGGLFFPNKKMYDAFLTQEGYHMLAFMRFSGLINRKQKLIGMMATETPYFLHTGVYNKINYKISRWIYCQYDAFICIGDLEYDLMKQILAPNSSVKLLKSFNGVSKERLDVLQKVEPDVFGYNIVTIGSAPTKHRMYYKGWDLLISAFEIIKHTTNLPVSLTIIGEYNIELIEELMAKHRHISLSDINFTGQLEDFSETLNQASIYVHIARGEAWGVSINEAMIAGLPAIVSEDTGAKQAVKMLREDFVVPLDSGKTAEKIIEYFSFSSAEKIHLSKKSRKITLEYFTEVKAIEEFTQLFDSLVK